METQEKEYNNLIAKRVPPGDRWALVGDKKQILYESLTETLEAYFQSTGNACHFRLEPLNGQLFAIQTEVEEIEVVPPKKFNIYGDFD
tara:strand:- start:1743 stop:2006 length:264 start_codon:yes stop_codon:yes gene_type:complete